MLTSQVNLCERCVVMECFSHCRTRSEVDAVDCHFTMFIVAEKTCVTDAITSDSQKRERSVSVVFVFSDSHSAITPSLCNRFADFKVKREWMQLLCFHSFLLCSPLRLSFVSVVLTFNASFNAVAPYGPRVQSVG